MFAASKLQLSDRVTTSEDASSMISPYLTRAKWRQVREREAARPSTTLDPGEECARAPAAPWRVLSAAHAAGCCHHSQLLRVGLSSTKGGITGTQLPWRGGGNPEYNGAHQHCAEPPPPNQPVGSGLGLRAPDAPGESV
ncbi:unnamed protein product [Pleuronectes platessa]|uniref:Uncharacterized protein n=1 Tax=Pleuronectes platessa TaxID=8262 RepID=A0A9N7VPN4_PLEPL|nr:unnamed protein product [Pleuronectes platessa]